MEPVAPSLPTSPNHGPGWEAVNHASAMALAPSPVYVDMDGDQQANPLATVPEHIDFGANNELRQRHGSIARSRRASVGGGDDVEHFLRARNASVFGKAASFKRPRVCPCVQVAAAFLFRLTSSVCVGVFVWVCTRTLVGRSKA